jgi:hypothetical protein
MPIEQPTRFDLVVNLKTAKVGLTIPEAFLIRTANAARHRRRGDRIKSPVGSGGFRSRKDRGIAATAPQPCPPVRWPGNFNRG